MQLGLGKRAARAREACSYELGKRAARAREACSYG